MHVWVDLGKRVILRAVVGLVGHRAPQKKGFTYFLELLLWEPLKSNGYEVNNYLKERQIYLDKMCYLREIHFVVVVNLHSRVFFH